MSDLPEPLKGMTPERFAQYEREQKALKAHTRGGIDQVKRELGLRSNREAMMVYEQAVMNYDNRQRAEELRTEHQFREQYMIEKLMPAVEGVWDEEKGQWSQQPSTNAAKAILSIHDRQASRYDSDLKKEASGPSLVINVTPPWERDGTKVIEGEVIDVTPTPIDSGGESVDSGAPGGGRVFHGKEAKQTEGDLPDDGRGRSSEAG